ncbi:EAL domain-containing protein [Arthrobacter sp. UYCu712]|uniref:EAL domain-containing protein n=1 Tax=Arthrobacter sp. UYCu712 TaxID=3156340 RepID=UPI0033944AF5
MSMDESSLPAGPGTQRPADPVFGGSRRKVASGIHRQASAIIDAVLSDPAPEQALIRDRLREHLNAHPGHPETALTEHLISLGSLGRFVDGAHVPSAASSDATHPEDGSAPSAAERALRIQAVLRERTLVAAFQPIFDLSTGNVVGAEALTRFVSDRSDAADWFAAAAGARLESELEFAALECALAAAQHLPAHLFVALKLSPATCLDPLLPGLLQGSMFPLPSTVLQLTGALTTEQPAALVKALAALRRCGVRLAVDRVGSYFDSLSHIRQLKPDIIKLDRNLISGITTDPLHYAFGDAMTGFAEQFGATVVAEGIETPDELAAVTGLGAMAGQGYLLGRPTASPRDWASWNYTGTDVHSRKDPGHAARP